MARSEPRKKKVYTFWKENDFPLCYNPIESMILITEANAIPLRVNMKVWDPRGETGTEGHAYSYTCTPTQALGRLHST